MTDPAQTSPALPAPAPALPAPAPALPAPAPPAPAERTDEEWEAVFEEDRRTSLASERRLIWMELLALAAVGLLIVLHFVWH